MFGFGDFKIGSLGSEKRKCEAEGTSDDEMAEELKDIVDTAQYPQCKSTFAQKVRMSNMIGKVTGDQTASIMWEDSLIDKEARRFLKKKENGKHLPLDIVGHLEFFFNTLLMSHESVNPFKRPTIFEALLYPIFNAKISGPPRTILDVHKQLIFPCILEGDINDPLFDSPSNEDTESLMSLASIDPARYNWYPNRELEAQMSQCTVSPTPKRFD